MITALHASGRAMLGGLTLDGRWIAMSCGLRAASPNRGLFGFKTAYDEELSGFAPGRQLEVEYVRHRLEALATESGVGDRVQLPGQSPTPGAWLEQAGIFALTSSYEGYPNALAEAMAAGLAVVSTACPIGPRTMVRHGVDGLLVANGDLQELSHALGQLMRDPSLRSRLGTACRDSRRAATPDEAVANWTGLLLRAVGAGVHTTGRSASARAVGPPAIPFASRERLMVHTWSRSQFPRVRVAWFCDRPAWVACFTLAEFKQCSTAERRFGFVRRPFPHQAGRPSAGAGRNPRRVPAPDAQLWSGGRRSSA